MGLSNSKKLLELSAKSKEKEAIKMLSDTYLIDPNYTNVGMMRLRNIYF